MSHWMFYPLINTCDATVAVLLSWVSGGPWGTTKTLPCRLLMPQISTSQKRFVIGFSKSRQQWSEVKENVLVNFCFYLREPPQNRNDIKNGSILRLTTSPVSFISLHNALLTAWEHWSLCRFLSSLSTSVPDCGPAPRTDPVVQHGRQAGVSEGPGQCVEGHHLRTGVHQPGRHLPAHSDGGEWDRVSQKLDHLFSWLCHHSVLLLDFHASLCEGLFQGDQRTVVYFE